MKTITPSPIKIAGIYRLIGHKLAAAGASARSALDTVCPRTRHEMNTTADMLQEEAEGLCEHVKGNVEVIEGIEHLIHYLQRSKIRSTQRSLCQHDLEAASSRLRRELGEPDPARDFEIVKPEAAQPAPEEEEIKP